MTVATTRFWMRLLHGWLDLSRGREVVVDARRRKGKAMEVRTESFEVVDPFCDTFVTSILI